MDRSKRLHQDALGTRQRVEGDLRDRLKAAMDGVDLVRKMNQLNKGGLDDLNRAMDRLQGSK